LADDQIEDAGRREDPSRECREEMRMTMRRLLTEPLLHFLVVGGAL